MLDIYARSFLEASRFTPFTRVTTKFDRWCACLPKLRRHPKKADVCPKPDAVKA